MTTDERKALEVYEAMRTKKGKHLEENIEDEDEDIPMDENDDTGNFCEYLSIFLQWRAIQTALLPVYDVK